MIGNVTDVIVKGESKVKGECIIDLLLFSIGILVIGDLLSCSTPKGSPVECISNTEHHRLHAGIELTIDFFEVDDVETVGSIVTHVRHFEVEPLMITKRIDIRSQDQIVFVFGDLEENQ